MRSRLASLLWAAGVFVGPTAEAQEAAPPVTPVPQRIDPEAPRRHTRSSPKELPPAPGTTKPAAPGMAASTVATPPPSLGTEPVGPPRHLSSAPRREAPSPRTEASDSAQAAERRRETDGRGKKPSSTEELIRRSTDDIDFYELVDEMLDEIAHQLGKQDPALLSPIAIRSVRLSPNIRPEFARTLEARVMARLGQATDLQISMCVECSALRSRVENGMWLVSLGAPRQDDLRRLGATLGVKTFLDLGFTFNPQSNTIWMEATAFRASDAMVVWTDAYRSDGTTAALLRSGRRIPSRGERLDELEKKVAARPSYGYAVSLGVAQLGYDGPAGNIGGGMATLRFHERFGPDQSNLFGLSAGIFTNGPPGGDQTPLNSILVGAYYSRNLSEPNLNKPEFWVYGEAGGMFSGNQGNTFYVEAGGDYHMKWRLSLVGGVMYVRQTRFADYDLGGIGYRLRIAMNW